MTSIACTFALLTYTLYPLYLGKSKKVIFNSIIHTYFRLFTLSQKKTNCYLLTHHTFKMLPHYLVKCTNFHLFHFFHMYQVPPICDMDELLKHLVATWLNFSTAWWTMQLISGQKDWKHVSVQKVVSLNICCSAACLTFHLPHITTGSSQSHQCDTQLAFFRATNVWSNATYLQSDEKVVHFTR